MSDPDRKEAFDILNGAVGDLARLIGNDTPRLTEKLTAVEWYAIDAALALLLPITDP